MSLWKFNNVEVEADFTDAAFMEKFENAYDIMSEELKHVQKIGKQSEIIRSYCEVFFGFFDRVFGEGTHNKLFGDKVSIDLCVEASNSLYEIAVKRNNDYRQMSNKYNVQLRGHNKKQQYMRKR